MKTFENPFRPGAGHMPPYLAGREVEKKEFEKALQQTTILENLVLTGLRGVGKTVLLETFKPLAIREGWLWVGTDLSESVNTGEQALVVRLLTDLSVVTSGMVVKQSESAGFASTVTDVTLDYKTLSQIYASTPGLIADKLSLQGGVWDVIGALNDNFGTLGYLIIAIFAASWIISAIVYRVKRYDELEIGG